MKIPTINQRLMVGDLEVLLNVFYNLCWFSINILHSFYRPGNMVWEDIGAFFL